MNRNRREHGERRKYGDARGYKVLYAQVSESSKLKVDHMAQSAGISLARMVELVIEHTEIDDNGVPTFYNQEELPFAEKRSYKKSA